MPEQPVCALPAGEGDAEELTGFLCALNREKARSSAFCPETEASIRREVLEAIAAGSAALCRAEGRIAGALLAYPDPTRNNADVSLLADSRVSGYTQTAEALLGFLRRRFGEGTRFTFYFPLENEECLRFLEASGGRRQTDEYGLLLLKGGERLQEPRRPAAELPAAYRESLAHLHDAVFPGLYVSGRELLEDCGRGRRIFALLENGRLDAYSVLRLYGGSRAGAEIVGVREGCRHRGLGREVLSHLIRQAFSLPGVTELSLIVDSDNQYALRLYRSLGFCPEAVNRSVVLKP